MTEKWRKKTVGNKVFGAFLTDLSKAFDCKSPDLSFPALIFVQDYRQNHKQRVKVDTASRQDILAGVPQGSILGPIRFNIFTAYDITPLCR